jgi:hypothetical protein
LADAKPVHLGHVARADGAWRIYIFGDRADPADQYVAHVLPLHGHEALADFFAGILIDAK